MEGKGKGGTVSYSESMMTKVEFKVNKNVYDIRVTGHAGYHPGNDPVCAAASILVTTLAQRAKDVEEMGLAVIEKNILESGHARVTVRSGYDGWHQAVLTVMTGFELLAYQFPQHVKILCRVGE